MKSYLRKSSPLPECLPCCSPLAVKFAPVILGLLLMSSACSAPVPRPTGAAKDLADAKDMFGKSRYDRALDFTDGFVRGEPGDYNERGRVLRAIILSGEVNAYKDQAETYDKGANATHNPQWKSEYLRLRHDNLQYASRRALALGEVAHALTGGGNLPKELTLEAPYPGIEGPLAVSQFARVREGGWIEPGDQEAAAIDEQRMSIENALAEALRGDRVKARAEMNAGPVKLEGAEFGLFLGNELVVGASTFDRKHLHDPAKMRALCSEADATAKATATLLKAAPDPEKQKRLKKLQDEIKTTLKND
jgi:hypothetical protein